MLCNEELLVDLREIKEKLDAFFASDGDVLDHADAARDHVERLIGRCESR